MAPRGPNGLSEQERFERHIDRTDTCWLWNGSTKAAGYGTFQIRREGETKWRAVNAHRYAYELWVGPIPEGLQIDHLCATPACVRPDHLDVVTQAENLRRKSERIYARPFCHRGHEIAVVGRTKAGKCKACVSLRNKARWDKPARAERTHCPAGHPYDGDNLRIVKTKTGTGRRCRTCDNIRNQEQYRKRRARGLRK